MAEVLVWDGIRIRSEVKKRLKNYRAKILSESPKGTKIGFSELIDSLLDKVEP